MGFFQTDARPILHQTAGSLLATLLVLAGAGVISAFAARSYYLTQQPFYRAAAFGVLMFLALATAILLIALTVNLLRRSGSHDTGQSPAIGQSEIEKALIQCRSQVGETEHKLSKVQEQYDDTKWLRDIADEQAKDIPRYISFESRIEEHRLLGDDPFIHIGCFVTNRAVYQITLENELSGCVYFAGQRLSKEPILLPDNRVKNVRLNEEKWFGIHQRLTQNEAAEILSGGGQFGLYSLHGAITTNPSVAGMAEPIALDLIAVNGPVVDTEFLKYHYPKVAMEIKPSDLRSYFQYRKSDQGTDLPTERLGTVVTLWVQLRNPRPLKVRQFKLVTSGPVVTAQHGAIRETPHRDTAGRNVSTGQERYPNLADLKIYVEKDNITEGWLQFIVPGVEPEKMLDPSTFVVRLHIVDESGEEHKQDVIGFRLAF
jgi:hypothetical protein